MIKTIRVLGASMLCMGLLANSAIAQDKAKSYPNFAVGMNLGFQTLGGAGGNFEIGFDAPIQLTEHYSIGPWLQVGVASQHVNLLVSANSRWKFDFLERTQFSKVEPFVQGGLGLAYRKQGSSNSTDFLMNMGLGAEVPVTDHLYLGSDIMFNTVPTLASGGAFNFSWQFATLRYRF
jgi:hypothetical protein